MTMIRDIPNNIKDNSWTIKEVEVGQIPIDSTPNYYQIIYCDVVKVVEFLMSHCLFANHLAYALVR